MTDYKDTKTPELIERLHAFWHAQEVLKRDWEPFSQADLLFESPTAETLDADQDTVNPSLSSMEPQKAHWHSTKAVDPHYYLAAGEEPEQEPGSFYRGLWNLLKWWIPMGAAGMSVWWLWVTLWPEAIKWLVMVAGR